MGITFCPGYHCGMVKTLSVLIKLYQAAVSPFLPSACRYVPSCSEYARQALFRYGVLKGTGRALRRLFRCHPFCPGGYDPLT